MEFVWNHKIKLFGVIILLFIISIFSIVNTQIFFDTERIINDISNEEDISKLIDDENLIFLGISTNKTPNYVEFKKLKEIHNNIRSQNSVKRVTSIINERKIIPSGILTIPIKLLDLSDETTFYKSINSKDFAESNFIDTTKTKFFFLIDAKKNLSSDERYELIQNLYQIHLSDLDSELFISGRIPSEVYFQKKVIKEFLVLTTLSAILCFILLYFLTTNLKLILLIISSVIISIIVTLALSTIIYAGLEMIMIISPAILFIVCISDAMHYTSNQEKYKNKVIFFKERIDKIGKAILLTSITTSFSFLTFLLNDILPIARFGLITSFGILFTLIVVTIIYAISIDYNFNQIKQHPKIKKTIDFIINFSLSRKKKYFHFTMILFLGLGIFSISHIKIDNYLTDEVNEKSQMYVDVNFFDTYFGGIKPIHFKIDNLTSNKNVLREFKDDLNEYGIKTDVSNIEMSNQFLSSKIPVYAQLESQYLLMCRMKDIGSIKTNKIITELNRKYHEKLIIKPGGVGYVFDSISFNLTKKLIYGLLIAITSIGFIFFFLTKFNFKFLIISIIPNLTPIILTLGIIQFFNFYFSLSNAFIFTIVFGLIVDDSIHIISAYLKKSKEKLIEREKIRQVVKTTGKAVVKTTFVIIFCLFPLIFSEFKSVSQLGTITIISAIFAVLFDLIYLPWMIMKSK
jgi:predicted RND superfamily exporter protein